MVYLIARTRIPHSSQPLAVVRRRMHRTHPVDSTNLKSNMESAWDSNNFVFAHFAQFTFFCNFPILGSPLFFNTKLIIKSTKTKFVGVFGPSKIFSQQFHAWAHTPRQKLRPVLWQRFRKSESYWCRRSMLRITGRRMILITVS
ncbi:hypothetical protein CASFOL_015546 [Castilleja foliolosa]|uniref:Uncharacterized protein n=1 Tax=Castilleja foliolosa TaxID=1961234 RepID=A0ABD3DEL6_9LAMI